MYVEFQAREYSRCMYRTDRSIDKGKALPNVDASRVHTVCHAGDTICENSVIILPAHLTYAVDVASAADFAVAAAKN